MFICDCVDLPLKVVQDIKGLAKCCCQSVHLPAEKGQFDRSCLPSNIMSMVVILAGLIAIEGPTSAMMAAVRCPKVHNSV